jgi:hypothetical protein
VSDICPVCWKGKTEYSKYTDAPGGYGWIVSHLACVEQERQRHIEVAAIWGDERDALASELRKAEAERDKLRWMLRARFEDDYGFSDGTMTMQWEDWLADLERRWYAEHADD